MLKANTRVADRENGAGGPPTDAKVLVKVTQRLVSSAHLRDVNWLRRSAYVESLKPETSVEFSGAAEVERLRYEIAALRSSRSWRLTAPLRSVGRVVKHRLSFVVRLVKRLRA